MSEIYKTRDVLFYSVCSVWFCCQMLL